MVHSCPPRKLWNLLHFVWQVCGYQPGLQELQQALKPALADIVTWCTVAQKDFAINLQCRRSSCKSEERPTTLAPLGPTTIGKSRRDAQYNNLISILVSCTLNQKLAWRRLWLRKFMSGKLLFASCTTERVLRFWCEVHVFYGDLMVRSSATCKLRNRYWNGHKGCLNWEVCWYFLILS